MLNLSPAPGGAEVTGAEPHCLPPSAHMQSPGTRLDAPSSPNAVLASLLGHHFFIAFLLLMVKSTAIAPPLTGCVQRAVGDPYEPLSVVFWLVVNSP